MELDSAQICCFVVFPKPLLLDSLLFCGRHFINQETDTSQCTALPCASTVTRSTWIVHTWEAPSGSGPVIIPVSQVGKVRHREVT